MLGRCSLVWIAAIGSASVVAGCSREPERASAESPIVVGVSLGLTREFASVGASLRDAVRVAEGELNAGGGVLGRQIRFEIVDDRSDEAAHIVEIAQSFVDRGVVAVLGPLGSGQVLLTQTVFGEHRILQISPTATSVELEKVSTDEERFSFRTTPADDLQATAVLRVATSPPRGLGGGGGTADGASCNRLALVHLDNAYGTSMAKTIVEAFPKMGEARKVVARRAIPLEVASSYANVVSELIASEPDCLVLVAYEKAGAAVVRELKTTPGYAALRERGFFVIGTDGIHTEGFLDASRDDPSSATSASSAEGVFGTSPDTQPRTADYNAFKSIYASYFPLTAATEPPPFAANTFDAAILLGLAIQKAGAVGDRGALRDALKDVSRPGGTPVGPAELADALVELRSGGDVDYRGASGNVDLQDNGDVTGGFIVWHAVRDRTSNRVVFETVARLGYAELKVTP